MYEYVPEPAACRNRLLFFIIPFDYVARHNASRVTFSDDSGRLHKGWLESRVYRDGGLAVVIMEFDPDCGPIPWAPLTTDLSSDLGAHRQDGSHAWVETGSTGEAILTARPDIAVPTGDAVRFSLEGCSFRLWEFNTDALI